MNRDLVARSAQFFVGLIGVGLGAAMMIDAHVGLSPWDVLHQGIHRHVNVGIGTVSIVVGLLLFVLWIPLKQRITVGTAVNIAVIGTAINQFLRIDFHPRGAAAYAVCVVGDVVISAAGGIYIGAGLGTGPRDGLMTGLVDRGFPLRTVRTVIELSVLALGWALGGNIGFGTVLFAVTVGPILHFVLHHADRGRYGFAEEDFPPPAVS